MFVGGLPESYKVAFSLLIAVYSLSVKANSVSALLCVYLDRLGLMLVNGSRAVP